MISHEELWNQVVPKLTQSATSSSSKSVIYEQKPNGIQYKPSHENQKTNATIKVHYKTKLFFKLLHNNEDDEKSMHMSYCVLL